MLRKIVLLLLACTLVSGVLFAGGGGQAQSGQVITESSNFNLTGYPIVKEKINLRSAIMRVVDLHPRALWERIEEVTNIHVDFFCVDTQQTATFMAAGDWPDFFHTRLSPSIINDQGMLGKNLVDYRTLEKYTPNLLQGFVNYPISKKAVTEIDGGIYQLPYIEIQVTAHGARFYYRTDHLKNNNLQPPVTIDDLYNCLVVLKRADGRAHMLATMDELEGYLYTSFGDSREPGFDADAQNKVIFNRASEQYKRFLKFMYKCYSEGLIHPEFLTLDNASRLQLSKDGYVTFGTGTCFDPLLQSDFPSGTFDIGVPAPFKSQWNSAPKINARLGDARRVGGAINAKSRYIPEIARMIDIGFAMKEIVPNTGLYGIAYNYGPEGLSWKFTSPAKTEMSFFIPPQYSDVQSHAVLRMERMIHENPPGISDFGNAITAEISNNRARQMGFRDYLMPNATKDFFPGNTGTGYTGEYDFLHYTPEEQAVLDSKFVDIDTYIREMRAQFVTGVLDIDREWDRYTKTLNDMGIADIIKIRQAAYDRWNQM